MRRVGAGWPGSEHWTRGRARVRRRPADRGQGSSRSAGIESATPGRRNPAVPPDDVPEQTSAGCLSVSPRSVKSRHPISPPPPRLRDACGVDHAPVSLPIASRRAIRDIVERHATTPCSASTCARAAHPRNDTTRGHQCSDRGSNRVRQNRSSLWRTDFGTSGESLEQAACPLFAAAARKRWWAGATPRRAQRPQRDHRFAFQGRGSVAATSHAEARARRGRTRRTETCGCSVPQ